MVKTKKVKAAGKFGAGYGTSLRNRFNAIEIFQRKKQNCPHCKKSGVKRLAAGIWNCEKCGAKFAGHAYTLNK
ncbi:50S ribosomal protein L37ae [Candidatus Pacearchaeota archaeon]|nr:50S ribosomal protein L37ae [Candidatus Pacearchaeota archaeon]